MADAPKKYEEVVSPKDQPYMTLHTGAKMPVVSLGTASNEVGLAEAVSAAFQMGYRSVDTAWLYGSEKACGEGLRASGVPREEVFVTTKLWSTFRRKEFVEPMVRESLANLGMDYLDNILIHWPICFKNRSDDERKGLLTGMQAREDWQDDVPFEETWKALEECVDKGLCRHIGLSNFSEVGIREILAIARIRPATLQIEGTLWLQQPTLVQFCKEQNIAVTLYSTLGSAPLARLLKLPVMLEDAEVIKTAEEAGRSPADLALRWAVELDCGVPPKSTNSKRIAANLQACMNPLPEGMMEKLKKMDRGLRVLDDNYYFPKSGEYPESTPGRFRKAGDIWKLA